MSTKGAHPIVRNQNSLQVFHEKYWDSKAIIYNDISNDPPSVLKIQKMQF